MKWEPRTISSKKTLLPKPPSNNTLPFIATVCGAVLAYQFINTPLSISNIFAKTSKSIVTVSSMGIKKDVFSPTNTIPSLNGTGTGFSYINKDYIITNAHVIQDAVDIKIKLSDNTSVSANIVGVDAIHDIAVLNIKKNLTPLKKCLSPVKIGQEVLAIGNPFGLDRSITEGIISGVERSFENNDDIPLVDLLQTDAPINPGNSGGPLLDAKKGCVLGLNTAIISSSGVNAGVGFAIPIDKIDDIVQSIIYNNPLSTYRLGISMLPDRYAELFNIQGIIIADVIPDGKAEKMGLIGTHRDANGRPILGDIITSINNNRIKKRTDLYKILNKLSKDSIIEIEVLRETGIQKFRI
jgi:S1-C subfamily serine protease